MKDGTENKLKFKQLQRTLKLTEWQARGLLDSLWRFVRINCPEGDIGRFTNEEIAIGIDWQDDGDTLVSSLVKTGWLDEVARGAFENAHARLWVHDWWEHCEDSVHKSLARRTEAFADGTLPKLTRFSEKERAEILAKYKVREKDAQERTETHADAPSTPKPPQKTPSQCLSPALALAKPINDRNREPTEGDFDLEEPSGPTGESARSDAPPDSGSNQEPPVTPLGRRIRVKASYIGPDTWPFERAAALLQAAHVTEAEVFDAAEGCRTCKPENPPAYFWSLLTKSTAGRIPDLNALARDAMASVGRNQAQRDSDMMLEAEWGPDFDQLDDETQKIIRGKVLEANPAWARGKLAKSDMVKTLIRQACLAALRDSES